MTQQLPILKRGSTGEHVEHLQHDLSLLGYELKIDGIFGPATENAVKKFQQDNNLTVDGIVGPQTGRLIGAALT
ncbi:MAG: peptidoglycan-binding protein [Scytonema sp. RU_4_4]|nr:peptidoglycan-binding protein [Scytonema sp. RU_4_4]NJR73106.1 peptidoglycan-binding protein [Scytonema sp. CRU_2_7]